MSARVKKTRFLSFLKLLVFFSFVGEQTQTPTLMSDTFISFEAIKSEVKIFSQSVSILIVYRPPPSSGNNLSTELFMNEFSSLLESYITKTGSLVITGDFNFHVDDTTDTAAANFLSLLESFTTTCS